MKRRVNAIVTKGRARCEAGKNAWNAGICSSILAAIEKKAGKDSIIGAPGSCNKIRVFALMASRLPTFSAYLETASAGRLSAGSRSLAQDSGCHCGVWEQRLASMDRSLPEWNQE
ncbi:hypothetical protein NDU88_010785 [Pleurodeles waltl]|uniref:Uncharacterized protein n=1 Tax=Pleurodeles waltl TaxID=8319 RepID=A0AAV7RZ70_PLEWA|nr:hypothetical protein NDU88_010785 [Pleurodeles waltl]